MKLQTRPNKYWKWVLISLIFVLTIAMYGCGQSVNKTNDNGNGQQESTFSQNLAPAQVIGLTQIRSIATGNGDQDGQLGNSAAYALKSDGSVWAWGNNGCGQLGNKSTVNSSVPVQVADLTKVTAVSGGYETAYAVKLDGSVWAWGNNASGQLGKEPGTGGSHVPIQVKDLIHVTSIVTAGRTAYALESNGTVWTWGERPPKQSWKNFANSHGLVQIPKLDNIIAITSGGGNGYALKADGTVWGWGWNGEGELGNLTNTEEPPVQIKDLENVTAIATRSNGGYAFKQNGTVWAWGGLFGGYLGNNSSNGEPLPVQVSELMHSMLIVSADYDSYALKTDGTVWAWGENHTGQLGNGKMK